MKDQCRRHLLPKASPQPQPKTLSGSHLFPPLASGGQRAGHTEGSQWILQNPTKSGRDHPTVQMGKLRPCRKKTHWVPQREIVGPGIAPGSPLSPHPRLYPVLFSAQGTGTNSLIMEGQIAIKGLNFINAVQQWSPRFLQPQGSQLLSLHFTALLLPSTCSLPLLLSSFASTSFSSTITQAWWPLLDRQGNTSSCLSSILICNAPPSKCPKVERVEVGEVEPELWGGWSPSPAHHQPFLATISPRLDYGIPSAWQGKAPSNVRDQSGIN